MSTPDPQPPELVLRRARIEHREGHFDVALAGGRIAAIEPLISADGKTELEVEERLVSPAFVETHCHLDKNGTLPMNGAT